MKPEFIFIIALSILYAGTNILFVLNYIDYIKLPKGFFNNPLALIMLFPTVITGIIIILCATSIKIKIREYKYEQRQK